MKSIIDIPNACLPVAVKIREALEKCTPEYKRELLEGMTETEFVDHRVDIFLDELERAIHSSNYTPAGAEEISMREAIGFIRGN